MEPTEATVFVRDRGPGFDPAAVPEDRMGVRQSIRAGWSATGRAAVVRTAPGEGTEVSLTMPAAAGNTAGRP